MMRVMEQTHEEKVIMYMKLSKRELIEMLINSNKALDAKGWAGVEVVPGILPNIWCTGDFHVKSNIN